MASTDLSQHIRQGVEHLRADEGQDPMAGCRAGDLKGLLNAIVDQISEADRRHSDTLAQLQDRLTGIGREAKAIKPRVPENFAAAFERIEAGMAELASRITETSTSQESRGETSAPAQSPFHHEVTQHTTLAPAPSPGPAQHAEKPTFADPPAALRSASDHVMAATRRREEEVSRAQSGVDTFDVIESSLPGNVSDPWDRDSAEALTGLYESGTVAYSSKPVALEMPVADVRPAAAVSSAPPVHSAMPAADHSWLESRFAEISKGIEDSIQDIRPDQGFFALGQRVDQLERHFGSLFEGVATRGDVEGVRLIEAHVSELAGHLENAHHQLMRLDVIEDHLAGIAAKLEDVHHAASASNDDSASHFVQPEIDMTAVARTAAETAAAHFAKMQPQTSPEAAEIRNLLSDFIAESRQGEESTTALLDTLQQAMIRLLDRVDNMELHSLQRAHAEAQAAPQEYVREQVRFGVDNSRNNGPMHTEHTPVAALDAAVAAVASAKSMSSPYGQPAGAHEMPDAMHGHPGDAAAPQAARSTEKLRQDFIADARRAKMRLAAEGGAETVVIARPELEIPSTGSEAKPPVRGGKSASKPAPDAGKSSAASLLTPRLRVMALGSLLLLGGGWYAMHIIKGRNSTPLVAESSAAVDAKKVLPAKEAKATAPETVEGQDSEAPSADSPPPPSAPIKDGATQLNLQQGTVGEIVNEELTVGSTSVPLFGVTVDSEKQMSVAEVARVRRQQAIASASQHIGQAAQQNPEALAIPASLHPDTAAADGVADNAGQSSIVKSGMSQSSALDLPPATVGPLSLRLAAANGDASAQFEVGARLAEGKGTNQNFKDAAKWYQKSAEQGFAQAQYRIGTLYERGLGLKPDMVRASDWYKKAAEQGNIKAMHNLAVLSANQSKGSPDYATAAQWFGQAAERGLSDSQFNLAVLHENGLGVTQDLAVAYKWLVLAAKDGDKEAIRRRDILQGKMTAEQLTQAEAQISAWKVKQVDQQVNDPRKAGEAWKSNPANGVSG
jgi:localization factor PodJL